MSALRERMTAALTAKQGATKAGMARACNISKASVSDWFSGKTTSLDATNLIKAAAYLGVRPEWLATGRGRMRDEENQPGFDLGQEKGPSSDGVQETSNKKAVIDSHDREPIEGAIKIRMQRVPVVGTAQFGDEGYWDEIQYPVGHGDGYVNWPSKDQNAYALRGVGASMEPRIRHGEFIICEPSRPTSPGDDVMVRCRNGRTMAKRYAYKRDGMIYLDSINKDHPQIALPEDQIEKMHFIAGVANSALWEPAG